MSQPGSAKGVALPPEFTRHNQRGRYRQAFACVADGWADLVRHGSLADLLQLHTLCLRLGWDVRRRWLGRRIRRQWPDRLAARASEVRELLRAGRLLTAWERTTGELPAAVDAAERIDWLLAQARVHSHLRDFQAAERCLAAAEVLAPSGFELIRERAWMLQDRDDVDGAVALLESALAASPEDPDLLLQRGWLRHDRNDPGVGELLADLHRRLESPPMDGVYASHCLENGAPATARAIWSRLLDEPHHEPKVRRMWRFALVRTCRDLGDDAAALAAAEQAGRFGLETAAKLREHLAEPEPRAASRVVLPVPFVRQDHMTCSPATMASLLATFGMAVDQREIARQITVDGTASHDELVWAERHGLAIRWFQFDVATARALLDRGLPFAVTTRFENSSHRQAVIGYDRVLDTFVLRDPTGNFRREVPTEWLVHVTARGGECALLLPAAVAARHELPLLPLETATLQWMRARLDWRERRPQAAAARLQELGELPDGSLRHDIEIRLAREHGDRRRQLELWRERWTAQPDDPFWRYHYVGELLDQHRWQDARQLLEGWAPTTRSPFLLQMLADQWRSDARCRSDAERAVRRAMRWTARDGRSWQRLARLVSLDPARSAMALELTRIATTLAPFDEWLAGEHYRQLCNTGRAADGLRFLAGREVVRGGRSAAMASTYAEALAEQHQPEAAVAVLREAAVGDDDSGGVRMQLFGLLRSLHRFDEAAALLAEPGLRAVDLAWCRHQLAVDRGDHQEAQRALDDCLTADPWHEGAWQLRLDHLLEQVGVAEARAAAERLVATPGAPPVLLVRVAEFLERLDAHDAAEELLGRLVAEHPHEHWLAGRLARRHLHRGRPEAARRLLATLREAAPESSAVWYDIGLLAKLDGDRDAAGAAMRQSFVLDPSNVNAVRRLLDWAPSAAASASDLRFVLETLAKRPVAPDFQTLSGLLDLLPMLPRDEVLAFFAALAEAHPQDIDHRMAHIEFVGVKDPATAARLAAALAAERPWQSGHPLRHAKFLRELGRHEEERAVLEGLLQRDPGCAQAYVELGESLELVGQPQKALQVFERGRQRVPGYATLHGMLANAAWQLGDRERALQAVARAAELDADYRWAWFTRCDWLAQLDRHDEALAIATRLVADRPRSELAHEVHAAVLESMGRHGERVEALRQALLLRPRLGATRLRLIDALIELKRFADARAVVAEGRDLLGDLPELALRLANVERTAGRIAEARVMLRAALDQHPGYRDGWVRWMSWCEQEGRHRDILSLAANPPAVLANDAVLFGFAGEAHLRVGDRVQAEAALRRALELGPGYSWARLQLCELALGRGAPEEVLRLLGDHQDPDSQPFDCAVLIAKAACRTGDHDLAGRAFTRLLKQPDADTRALGATDQVLRNRMGDTLENLLKALAAAAEPGGVLIRNLARVRALRGEQEAFWAMTKGIHAALGADAGLVVLAGMFADLRDQLDAARIAKWVAANVTGPVADADTAGALMLVLSGESGDLVNARLFGETWRRTDLRGYMLANLGSTMRRLQRFDAMVEIAEFALRELPHDHSIWWHRRNLAEDALRRGAFARARELCEMPVEEHPSQRLTLHQLGLLVELRAAKWWRRYGILRSHRREMWNRYAAAMASDPDGTEPADLRGRDLFVACPGLTTALLCCGKAGVALLRLWQQG